MKNGQYNEFELAVVQNFRKLDTESRERDIINKLSVMTELAIKASFQDFKEAVKTLHTQVQCCETADYRTAIETVIETWGVVQELRTWNTKNRESIQLKAEK